MNNAPWRHTKKNGFMMNLLSILASRWIRLIVKYKYVRGIDLVVVHDSEQEKLLEGFGLRAINLAIPIDFENFYMPPKKIDYREKAVLLGIGALSPVRKFEDIITAAGFLRKYGVDTRIILICKDFWKDTAYKELLRAAARKYDMEDSVEFYFSGVNEKELRAILKRSHFYVFPNHIKIWSMSSFEAMAAGLVLAVSSATSVADVLRDGENAVFFNPGDAEALAIKIRELVMKPTDYARIAAAGQEFVRQNLNWQNYTKRFADALMRT